MGFACWWQSFSEVMSSFGAVEFVCRVVKQVLLASLSCTFAIAGGIVGCITGAAIGQTTETGFCRGCGVGTISGSLVALELVDSIVNHNLLSKVDLFGGPVDGDIFTGWLTHVLLKAYDFQIADVQEQVGLSDLSDIFEIDTGTSKGLSLEHISSLPTHSVHYMGLDHCDEDNASCPICLEDLREGECAKRLSSCHHEYHLQCIDAWLVRRGSCPVCRHHIVAS
uniref:RING-type domain-containing protein n=1 Tax=Kalanchoe fedtschenkoi TaxID=63787 RepID=A0A7N0ULH8_KALFE